jgi:hypothetical protein
MPPYLGALPYEKTIISLILRDATWPINQPPLVKTCSKEPGKDEKREPLLPKNTLANNAIFLRFVCKKKKWLHAPLVQAYTKFQPRI